MWNYLKCVYANKFCFIGMISLPTAILILLLEPDLFIRSGLLRFALLITFEISLILLVITGCGMETYQAYKRTREHIRRFGRIDKDFKFHLYCSQSGFKLAAKEAGINV